MTYTVTIKTLRDTIKLDYDDYKQGEKLINQIINSVDLKWIKLDYNKTWGDLCILNIFIPNIVSVEMRKKTEVVSPTAPEQNTVIDSNTFVD